MLEPINSQIVLKVIEQEAKTAGGIILTESAVEKPYTGLVVARNEQYYMPDGTLRSASVEVGDTVVFGKTHGTEVYHQGDKYLVIAEEFLLCKVK